MHFGHSYEQGQQGSHAEASYGPVVVVEQRHEEKGQGTRWLWGSACDWMLKVAPLRWKLNCDLKDKKTCIKWEIASQAMPTLQGAWSVKEQKEGWWAKKLGGEVGKVGLSSSKAWGSWPGVGISVWEPWNITVHRARVYLRVETVISEFQHSSTG